jgi:hypothetical protein
MSSPIGFFFSSVRFIEVQMCKKREDVNAAVECKGAPQYVKIYKNAFLPASC